MMTGGAAAMNTRRTTFRMQKDIAAKASAQVLWGHSLTGLFIMSKTIVRRTLRGFAVRDRIEQKILPFEAELAKAAQRLRIRLVTENPDMPDAEIDAKVARIMQHGSKPSGPATSPPPMEIPKEVRDARRAERREQKRRLRRHRRNNP
jgi:hypothetical protein